eukprot:2446642-Prymnesium_polylepis.1
MRCEAVRSLVVSGFTGHVHREKGVGGQAGGGTCPVPGERPGVPPCWDSWQSSEAPPRMKPLACRKPFGVPPELSGGTVSISCGRDQGETVSIGDSGNMWIPW